VQSCSTASPRTRIRHDLLDYADEVKRRGRLSQIALVHGEPKPQKVLRDLLQGRGHGEVVMPEPGERLEIK
jgi:metallo-beta-lactamase family protein